MKITPKSQPADIQSHGGGEQPPMMLPKYIRDNIESCHDADMQDPATRANIRAIVIPKLQYELTLTEHILSADGKAPSPNKPAYAMDQASRRQLEQQRDIFKRAIKTAEDRMATASQPCHQSFPQKPRISP